MATSSPSTGPHSPTVLKNKFVLKSYLCTFHDKSWMRKHWSFIPLNTQEYSYAHLSADKFELNRRLGCLLLGSSLKHSNAITVIFLSFLYTKVAFTSSQACSQNGIVTVAAVVPHRGNESLMTMKSTYSDSLGYQELFSWTFAII